jgi:hypothetical protein
MVDVQQYDEVFKAARELMLSRNSQYGNSIDIVKWQSVIDLCLMKLIRTREMKPSDIKNHDELIDCINYLAFAKLKLEGKMKEGV